MDSNKGSVGVGGAALNGSVETHGSLTGRDGIGGDQLHTQAGDGADKSVIGSKNVRQTISTRHESPDVSVTNNYERGGRDAADLVDRMEEKLEIQVDRLEDKLTGRIDNLEQNMNMKFEFVGRDIDELRRAPSRYLIPLLSVLASVLIAVSLFYFAGGMYSLSRALDQQQLNGQKNGVSYAKPQSTVGVDRR